jgi:hypothetical protein
VTSSARLKAKISKVKTLAISPTTNSKGKRDVTGAFLPEAIYFSDLHDSPRESFDSTKSKRSRRREVESILVDSGPNFDLIAFFMHGWKKGLQSGHNTWNVRNLAKAIESAAGVDEVKVALYACDTARDADKERSDDSKPGPGGEGGFADKLRDHLVDLGLSGGWVDAHTVTAHTTKAPYVRRFYINADCVNDGGEWLVTPGSPEWKAWRRALQEDRDFRLSFPLMTKSEIYARILEV